MDICSGVKEICSLGGFSQGLASKAATWGTLAVTLTDASSLMSARRFAGACNLEYFWVPGE